MYYVDKAATLTLQWINTVCSHLSVAIVAVEVAVVASVVVVAVLETLLTAHPVHRGTSDCRSLLHLQNPVIC